jgi:nucleoid DNA-binding protein
VNQADLIARMAERQGITKQAAVDFFGGLAEEVQGALGKGDEVTLPHLGKFKPVTRAARDARNPKTGEAVKVPAKTKVKFVAAKDLKDSLPKPSKAKK